MFFFLSNPEETPCESKMSSVTSYLLGLDKPCWKRQLLLQGDFATLPLNSNLLQSSQCLSSCRTIQAVACLALTYPSGCSSDSSDQPRLPPWSNTSDLQPQQIHAPNPCHPGRKEKGKKKNTTSNAVPIHLLSRQCCSNYAEAFEARMTPKDYCALFKWSILTLARGIL